MKGKSYTTAQAARAIGIGKSTLLLWLDQEILPEPRREKHGRTSYRVWTDADIERAVAVKLQQPPVGRPNPHADPSRSRLLELRQLLDWYSDQHLSGSPLREAREVARDLERRLS